MKTREELEKKLAEIESDERLRCSIATVQVNAPLALIQVDLKARALLLRWMLDLPHRQYHGEDED